MSRGDVTIDRDPEVQAIAKSLGLGGPRLKEQLCGAAVDKVRRHMDRFRIEPETLDDVLAVVLDMTGVRIVRVENDNDLARVSRDYRKALPALPVQLELEFAADTEALVFREETPDPRAPSFTAVVDARGQRRWKRWFAERHEPAHILVPDSSSRTLWRRTRADRPEPLEQVIDAIAARLGFWEPLVAPALLAALGAGADILDVFGRVRERLAPEASLEASYRALTRLVPSPLTLIRTDHACRRSDVANREQSFALRATTTMWNDPAERAGMVVWPNFRIPAHSVVHAARSAFIEATRVQQDDLCEWRTESGQALSSRALPVRVTARGAWAAIEPWP
jgi:hypothetical protein